MEPDGLWYQIIHLKNTAAVSRSTKPDLSTQDNSQTLVFLFQTIAEATFRGTTANDCGKT